MKRSRVLVTVMLDQVGYVPAEAMICRAKIIGFSTGDHGMRWDRLFRPVR